MIHINKSADKQFYVTVSANNGQIISTSETLKKKSSAWKNIKALLNDFGHANTWLLVQDNTSGKPLRYNYNPSTNTKQIEF